MHRLRQWTAAKINHPTHLFHHSSISSDLLIDQVSADMFYARCRANHLSCGCQTSQPRAPTRQGARLRDAGWGRPRAVPVVGEVADTAALIGELLGVAGIAAGGVFIGLWNTEKQGKAKLEQELAQLKEQLQAAQREVNDAQQQLQSEREARKEAESWRPRLDSATTELFKLEKALEIKDAQLAAFMNTARRQIKDLEENVKELQKM